MKQINELRRRKFLEESKEDLSEKTFYEKHYKTITPTQFFSYILSAISILFGVIAVYNIAMQTVYQRNTTIVESFQQDAILPYLLLFVAIFFLLVYELGKHHFYKQAFLEYYRNTVNFGSKEFAVAFILQVVSVCLSGYGGYIIANEISATQKTDKLYAIESEYESRIAEAKQNKSDFIAAKTWKGKISDKHTAEMNRLQQVVDNLEDSYRNAKVEAGVGDGFVAADETATKTMITMFVLSQVFIELFLFASLWWLIYFKSRVVYEEYYEVEDEPQNVVDITANRLQDTVENTPKHSVLPQRQIGFNTVAQRDTEEYNIDRTKKRVRTYLNRIEDKYTESLHNKLREDIQYLGSKGYKVTREDGSTSIENIGRTSKVIVQYDNQNNKIKLQYIIT